MNNVKDLIVDAPLRELFAFCEIFCLAACCQTDAYDHNATVISSWLEAKGEKGPLAKQQLDDLIAGVRAHHGPVRSVPDADAVFPDFMSFETEWPTGEACAAYLREWQAEFARALAFEPRPLDPRQCLSQAIARGEEDMSREIKRLFAEAHRCVTGGDVPRAIEIFSAIAGFETEGRQLESEITYARKQLAELRATQG